MSKGLVVAFDDVALQIGNTGIARYWREIHRAIFEGGILEDLGIAPIFLSRTPYRTKFTESHIDFPKFDFRYPAADRKLISAFCRDQKVDLFVSSYYTFSTTCPNLMFVYDLIPEVFGFNRLNRGWMERELSLYASNSFFAISENTKKDLIRFYPHTKNYEIGIGYPGINRETFVKSASPTFNQVGKRYFICVGSRYGEGGYKNGNLLINAVRSMDNKLIDFDLLFAGGEELTKDENDLVAEGKVKIERVDLSDENLVKAIEGAEALIYPSRYEGFGMPPLEALSLGTPVITTRNSSLPESVGELGIYVSSENCQELALAMLETDFLEVREQIKDEGPKRSKMFSWNQTANSFGETLRHTFAQPETKSSRKRQAILDEYSRIAINLQH
jgi:glycosyltransferase involved in cell wall biosynthesis